MPENRPTPGPIGRQFIKSLQELLEARGLSSRRASAAMEELGRALPPLAFSRIVKGERRVDVDELVALAVLLGVTPNALLFPRHGNRDDEVELTPEVRHRRGEIWEWADGREYLGSGRRSMATVTLATGPPPDPDRVADFKRYARPDGLGEEVDPKAASDAISVALDLAARIMVVQTPSVTERSEHIDYVIRGYRLLGLALEEMFAQLEQSGVVFDRAGAVRQVQSAIDEVRRPAAASVVQASSDPSGERH